MRVRMFDDPDFIATMNREFTAVSVILTDTGFPAGVPALDLWRNAFQELAWSHMSFAAFVILDPEGDRFYGHSTCQALRLTEDGAFAGGRETLRVALDRFKRARELASRSATDGKASRELERLDTEIERERREMLPCLHDHRIATARYLTGRRWSRALRVLAPGQTEVPVERGVREMAIRTLGTFLTDDRPFTERTEEHFSRIELALTPEEREEVRKATSDRARRASTPGGDSRPPVPSILIPLRKRGAAGLADLVDRPWSPDDPRRVDKARAWWNAHRRDPAYTRPYRHAAEAPSRGERRSHPESPHHLADDPERGIRWRGSLEEAMAEARERSLPVFVDLSVRRMGNPESPDH